MWWCVDHKTFGIMDRAQGGGGQRRTYGGVLFVIKLPMVASTGPIKNLAMSIVVNNYEI